MLAVLASSSNRRRLPDAEGRVMGPLGRLWPQVQYSIAERCGPGHFAPAYLGPAAMAVLCQVLECPANTVDHDASALTACRRVAS